MKPLDPNSTRRDPVAEFKAKARIEKNRRLRNRLITLVVVIAAGFAAVQFFPFPDNLFAGGDSPKKEVVVLDEESSKDPFALEVESKPEIIKEKPQEVLEPVLEPVVKSEPEPVEVPEVEPEPVEKLTADEKLAAEGALVLVGMDADREPALARDREIIDRVLDEGTWDTYRGLLQKSIEAGLAETGKGSGLNRFDPIIEQRFLYQALLRWSVLGWLSESDLQALQVDSYTGKFLKWMLTNDKAMEEFLLVIEPEDDGGKVLQFLSDVWMVNEEKYAEYFPLALACAVVFDNTVRIPHPLGSSASEGESTVDPIQRYIWYFEQNEKGKLQGPVNRMSARDLIWVVSAPIATSEMEWALRKVRLRRKSWGDAYGMIEYLMERAVEGLDPYEEYSFEEILKEGGICGDQSYFCMNTARANGIPAMTIVGETDGGPHAWVGVKTDPREWTTGVGRINGVSKGQTSNPQTGERITEQEILLWNNRMHQSETVRLNVWRLLWLADFFKAVEKPEDRAVAIRIANGQGRAFLETWQALYSLLENETEMAGEPEKPKNLEQWKDFASGMRREFQENPRIAVLASSAEMKYIFPYGSAGDAKRSFIIERRRIEREAGEQMDLIAESLKRESDLMLKRGDADAKREIMQLYDGALRDYGTSITGFKMMAQDYFGYFEDDEENGSKVARDIELAFKRVVDTGTSEWFRAKTEASIVEMICGFYRKAGEPDRADSLKRRSDSSLRRAKRDAERDY